MTGTPQTWKVEDAYSVIAERFGYPDASGFVEFAVGEDQSWTVRVWPWHGIRLVTR